MSERGPLETVRGEGYRLTGERCAASASSSSPSPLALLRSGSRCLLAGRCRASRSSGARAIKASRSACSTRWSGRSPSFLAAEEQRPFGHYEREYTPPGEPPGAVARSPLADPPALPFVIGYFQLDPDGSMRLPADRPPQQAAPTEISRAVDTYWASPADAEAPRRRRGAGSGIHGGARPRRARRAGSKRLATRARRDSPVSAYDALALAQQGRRAARRSPVEGLARVRATIRRTKRAR